MAIKRILESVRWRGRPGQDSFRLNSCGDGRRSSEKSGSSGLASFLLIGSLCCLVACAPTHDAVKSAPPTSAAPIVQSASPTAASQSSFTIGVATSSREGLRAMDAAQSLGITSVRDDVPWKYVETERGKYSIPSWVEATVNDARQRGMSVILILDYGNPLYSEDKPHSPENIEAFARYAEFVVQHFKGRVTLFELWNEWDAHTGNTTPGSADDYVALARVVYPRIKAANPSAVVLSGGISDSGIREGWMDRFFAIGGQRYVDAVSIHPYNWNSRTSRTPEGSMQLVDSVANAGKAVNGGRYLPMYITEVGWPTFSGRFGRSDDEAAWFVTRFLILANSRDYIRGVWWYGLRDQGTDISKLSENFGLLRSNFSPKPAAEAMRTIAHLLNDSARRAQLTQTADSIQARVSEKSGQPNKIVRWQTVDIGEAASKAAPREAKMAAPLLSGGGVASGAPVISDETSTR